MLELVAFYLGRSSVDGEAILTKPASSSDASASSLHPASVWAEVAWARGNIPLPGRGYAYIVQNRGLHF